MNMFKSASFWVVVLVVLLVGAMLIITGDDPGDEVAMTVGETSFTYNDVDATAAQMEEMFMAYGMQVGPEELWESVTERLIQEALFENYIKERGIEAGSEELDELIQSTVMMYGMETEEDLLEEFKAQGIDSREEMEEVLSFQLKVEKLMDIYADEVEVDEADAEEVYQDYSDQMTAAGEEENIQSFEDLEGEIYEQITQEEAYDNLMAKIEDMREDTEVEILFTAEYFGGVAEEMEPEGMQEGMEIELDPEDLEGGEEGMEIEVDAEEGAEY